MKKNILIIGGMGPQASLLLHKEIIDASIKDGAVNGEDFPAITHVSIPVPDFISDKTATVKALATIRSQLGYLWQPTF